MMSQQSFRSLCFLTSSNEYSFPAAIATSRDHPIEEPSLTEKAFRSRVLRIERKQFRKLAMVRRVAGCSAAPVLTRYSRRGGGHLTCWRGAVWC